MGWWLDHGQTTTCCQRATPDEIADEPHRYDCDQCALRERLDGLDRVNAEAWDVYGVCCGRLVRACGLVPTAMAAITAGWSADERADLIARLECIHAMLMPDGESTQT